MQLLQRRNANRYESLEKRREQWHSIAINEITITVHTYIASLNEVLTKAGWLGSDNEQIRLAHDIGKKILKMTSTSIPELGQMVSQTADDVVHTLMNEEEDDQGQYQLELSIELDTLDARRIAEWTGTQQNQVARSLSEMKDRWQNETRKMISGPTSESQNSDPQKTEIDQEAEQESGSSNTARDDASDGSSNIGDSSDSDQDEDDEESQEEQYSGQDEDGSSYESVTAEKDQENPNGQFFIKQIEPDLIEPDPDEIQIQNQSDEFQPQIKIIKVNHQGKDDQNPNQDDDEGDGEHDDEGIT